MCFLCKPASGYSKCQHSETIDVSAKHQRFFSEFAGQTVVIQLFGLSYLIWWLKFNAEISHLKAQILPTMQT